MTTFTTTETLAMSEVNERGNQIERANYYSRERYFYDFELCQASDGWRQWDTWQDAFYFGIWVHPGRREIVTFAEGDEIRVICPTEESYHAELASMAEFYGSPPPFAKTIDDDGKVTEYYEERPESGSTDCRSTHLSREARS